MNYPPQQESRADFILFKHQFLSDELAPDVAALSQACDALSARDLLAPYTNGEFIGSNGNVSQRSDQGGFLITATQLRSKHGLGPEDFVRITNCEQTAASFTTHFHGAKLPSSESLMHWHLFESFPEITAIVHVHEFNDRLYGDPARWPELNIVETARPGVPGTIDLGEVAREAFAAPPHYVILKDHVPPWDPDRTGTVILGRTLDEAIERTLNTHEQLAP